MLIELLVLIGLNWTASQSTARQQVEIRYEMGEFEAQAKRSLLFASLWGPSKGSKLKQQQIIASKVGKCQFFYTATSA